MKKSMILILFLLSMLLLQGCFSPFKEMETAGTDRPVINPNPQGEDAQSIPQDVALWVPIRGREYFVKKTVTISIPSGEMPERSVLQALLEFEEEDILLPVGWRGLSVREVYDNEQTLYVVLSKGFLSPTEGAEKGGEQAKALVLSITNTLTALGNYTQVQIMVDTADSGSQWLRTQRPTRLQAGFATMEEEEQERNTALGALSMDDALLLTPESAAEIVLSSFQEESSTKLYNMLGGAGKPTLFALEEKMANRRYALLGYELDHWEMVEENKEYSVTVVLRIGERYGGDPVEKEAKVRVINENDIWKVEYTSFERAVLL
ncbi:GerMN domain-containing protein [Eubacteriales bacterium OttesenSCG-928-M02]|nr:GerMN domain-containing protein [Eubacteriales bacterium OttesenSCG-928-M02]